VATIGHELVGVRYRLDGLDTQIGTASIRMFGRTGQGALQPLHRNSRTVHAVHDGSQHRCQSMQTDLCRCAGPTQLISGAPRREALRTAARAHDQVHLGVLLHVVVPEDAVRIFSSSSRVRNVAQGSAFTRLNLG
jgi:hypothetical protein